MSIKSKNISSEYIINHADEMHEEYDGDLPDIAKAIPFRFMVQGALNIRHQPLQNHYKTFLGEQKT